MFSFAKVNQSFMRLLLSFILTSLLFACTNKPKTPKTDSIKIDLTTSRFEQELFGLDTGNFSAGLDQLIAKYPSFGENFLTTILNTDPAWTSDSAASYVKGFVTAYRNVYDTAQLLFKDFSPYENEIRQAIRFVKYYFPKYNVPQKVITYIGPLDGFGDILSEDAFIVGLHHHLGKDFSMYKSIWVTETYPQYISNRFEPSYIPVNCMKNTVLDLFPEKMEDKSLVEQMIEKGKRLYVLSRLVPAAEEHKLIGYTKEQLSDCYAHERMIWDLFVQNNFLRTTDNNIIKNYIGEGPKTQELGEASPGNIGSFSGWQIVKKYMEKNPEMPLDSLMANDAEDIFQKTKYKP
jgi:hypothetical protein